MMDAPDMSTGHAFVIFNEEARRNHPNPNPNPSRTPNP